MLCSMDFILVFFSCFAFKFVAQVNEVLLEVIFNLRMFKCVIDRRSHESEFVTDIITVSSKFASKDALCLVKCIDGISQLDFVSSTWFLSFQNTENFRC